MHKVWILSLAVFISGISGASEPLVWAAREGDPFRGNPIALYGREIWLEERPMANRRLQLGNFNPEVLPQLNAWYSEWEAERRQPPAWKDADNDFNRLVLPHLRRLEGRRLVRANAGERPRPDFVALYFGADWCGPCHRFVPGLNMAYKLWQERGHDNVEIIFVSADHGSGDQLKYVREKEIPFLILDYAHTREPHIRQYGGRFYPFLSIVDGSGRPLNVNRERRAQEVLTDLLRLVQASNAWKNQSGNELNEVRR